MEKANDKATCLYKIIYKYLLINVYMYICMNMYRYINTYMNNWKHEHKILKAIAEYLDLRIYFLYYLNIQ